MRIPHTHGAKFGEQHGLFGVFVAVLKPTYTHGSWLMSLTNEMIDHGPG